MENLFNYHTSRDTSTYTQGCSFVQVMMSGYRTPSVANAKSYLYWPVKGQKFILHQDYYKTPTRFLFMTDERRKSLIEETSYLLRHGKKSNLYGIVFHMDTCFNRKFMSALFSKRTGSVSQVTDYIHILGCVQKHLTSKMYKTSEQLSLDLLKIYQESETKQEFVKAVERKSTLLFLEALSEALSYTEVKLLLENTTKDCDGMSLFSTHNSAHEFLQSLPKEYSTVSLCYDEEHAYASGWNTLILDNKVNNNFNFDRIGLVHLNTIPNSVEKGSKLDRHSETSLFEGKNSASVYRSVVEKLNSLGIPHIREVEFQTLLREQKQLKECK